MRWVAFAWVTASSAAIWTYGPSVTSPPVSGRSVATVIVPLHPAMPAAVLPDEVPVDAVPQAASAPNAAIVAIDKNPLVGLTICWLLLSSHEAVLMKGLVYTRAYGVVNRPLV